MKKQHIETNDLARYIPSLDKTNFFQLINRSVYRLPGNGNRLGDMDGPNG